MKKAFSLMELMVVIIILGLLAMFVLPNLTGKSEEAKQKLVCIQMKSVVEALNMYKLKTSTYPQTEEGLDVLINGFDLISFGADKKENTPDDIYYSKCTK